MPNSRTRKRHPSPRLSSASPRLLYGAELRYYREAKGLSQAQLADLLYVTPSFVANLETGRRLLHPDLAPRLDELLETNGFFVRHIEAGRSGPGPEVLLDIADQEQHAVTIRDWDLHFIPGLLQTDLYSAAFRRAHAPAPDLPEQQRRWTTRTAHRPLLRTRTSPAYWAVIHESALRRPLGGPKTMAAQLDALAELMRQGRAAVHVLPYTASVVHGLDSALRITETEDEHPIAHIVTGDTVKTTADPATVTLARMTHDLLLNTALPQDESLALIDGLRQEYDRQAVDTTAHARSPRA
ncbi:helix-turn-helix domain-containing protein [Actinacidiphila guanduensis]|uniref:Helix-turn-helix domain-containing protein n=1 Tax=Actinacidiphila guanduensis TaxID=310781 RepID=A0A1H0K1L4_9ACTN|nr:helix-turn-helix transcriptional regulator [Actinacidiphila guanduensis]SDO49749.1 Helix-turn-helix domain-containing protein [Actinacidiphila guanduensis]